MTGAGVHALTSQVTAAKQAGASVGLEMSSEMMSLQILQNYSG